MFLITRNKDGEITLRGKLPISTMGGLKSCGHPVETYMQMTSTAGENQVRIRNSPWFRMSAEPAPPSSAMFCSDAHKCRKPIKRPLLETMPALLVR